MDNTEQTRLELVNHLLSHLKFLYSSNASYDNGFEDESKRIATTIRVLFHDTSKSKSLLQQLNLKNRLSYLDTCMPYFPMNLMPHMGLLQMRVTTGSGASYLPVLDNGAEDFHKQNKLISFDNWWDKIIVLKDSKSNIFTRKNLILYIANQDGGSHVDPELDKMYWEITRNNSLGWEYVDTIGNIKKAPDNNPAFASVRQISYEVIKTFETYYGIDLMTIDNNELLNRIDNYRLIVKPDYKVGRNDPCPCGNNKKYKVCCGT